MKKEIIECTAVNYDPRAIAFRAYVAGAEWRINSVWNEPTIEAIRDEDILIEDIRGKFTVHKFYLEKWENMVRIYEIKRWAYIKDLIPNAEE